MKDLDSEKKIAVLIDAENARQTAFGLQLGQNTGFVVIDGFIVQNAINDGVGFHYSYFALLQNIFSIRSHCNRYLI
mgnify:CR=1 FL=1